MTISRREFVRTTAAAGSALLWGLDDARAQGGRFDLVLKGGRVIDPSLRLDAARDVAISGGRIVALVKPQFEAGRTLVRGGVVRDPAVHRGAIEGVVDAARAADLTAIDVIASPILGPEGNREFPLHIRVGEPTDAESGRAVGLATVIARAVALESA